MCACAHVCVCVTPIKTKDTMNLKTQGGVFGSMWR